MAKLTNHVSEHYDISTRLEAEATRLSVPGVVVGYWSEGDPFHLTEHRNLVAILEAFDTAHPGIGLVLPALPDEGDTDHITDHDLINTAVAAIEAYTP